MVGSQYLWTSVSKGEGLVEFGGQLLRRDRIARPRQSQRRRRAHIAVWSQLQSRIGYGTRLLPVSRFYLAQCRRCLIRIGIVPP